MIVRPLLLAATLLSAPAAGDSPDARPESAEASEARPAGLAALDFKLGCWRWKTEGLLDPGDPKQYRGEGFSHVYRINEGRALLDEHRIEWETGRVYRAITYRTYDAKTDTYLVVWAQADTRNASEIVGFREDDRFVEIERGKDGLGEWTNRLEIRDIEPDSHRAQLVRTYAKGTRLPILAYEATRVACDGESAGPHR